MKQKINKKTIILLYVVSLCLLIPVLISNIIDNNGSKNTVLYFLICGSTIGFYSLMRKSK